MAPMLKNLMAAGLIAGLAAPGFAEEPDSVSIAPRPRPTASAPT
jgi:hypothetical protein